MAYLLGIDIGTSSAKTVLIDGSGEVVYAVAPTYDFQTPHPLWAETDPEVWWDAVLKAIRSVLQETNLEGSNIAGVGLTGQMHGLVLLDAKGRVLRPCIMWNDQRTAPQCEALTEIVGLKSLLRLTGNPVLPGFTAPKILWVRENEPQVYTKAAKVLLPKDYIRYLLSGEFYTDVSDASGTSLLDVAHRRWSDEMLKACDIPPDWMAEVTESPVASTRVSAEAARATGLLEGTPIIAGGGDNAAGAVGCGIIEEGLVSASLGTSGVMFASSDEYRVDPEGRLHTFCHAVPGKWHTMGVMLSAAGSFQWYRNTLGEEELELERQSGVDAYDILVRAASEVPAGSEGLLFLPYLTGERTPHPDTNAKGVFFGLSLRHTKAHLTRAVMEGVTYGLRDSLELMGRLGLKPEQIRATGGGTRSALWRQIMADIFQTEIVTLKVTEGAAYGAALLGGVGAGVFKDVQDASRRAVSIAGSTQPNPQTVRVYDAFYPRYRALYPALAGEFEQLARAVEAQR